MYEYELRHIITNKYKQAIGQPTRELKLRKLGEFLHFLLAEMKKRAKSREKTLPN